MANEMRKNTCDVEGHVFPSSYLVDVSVCPQQRIMKEVLDSFVMGDEFVRDFAVPVLSYKIKPKIVPPVTSQ